MKEPETIEEELEIIAAALEAGIDPFPKLLNGRIRSLSSPYLAA